MLHTTFAKAKESGACLSSYKEVAKALGGVKKYGLDTPIPLDKVLEIGGLDDALWCLHITLEPADREIRLLACDYAERVLPIFEIRYPDDKRPRQAIEASRRFANGLITRKERDAAWSAAWAARAAAWEAAWAATGAAKAAAWAATGATAWAARKAAGAAWAAEKEWQKTRLLALLEKENFEPWAEAV